MPNNIDKMPKHDDAIGWSRFATSFCRGEVDPLHYHIEGQLLYATKGVMLVETGDKRWVIPPQRALWLPPEQLHTYTLLSATELRTVYFSTNIIAECTNFTKSSCVHVIAATSLVKELIAGLFSDNYQKSSYRTMALLLLEILNETKSLDAALPMPQDERLSRAVKELIINHNWKVTLSDIASIAAMSERNFSRMFIHDTGFTFRTWKQRVRICASMDLLANGLSIKQVAYRLGFSCPAAFVAAFRSIVGITPAEFLL